MLFIRVILLGKNENDELIDVMLNEASGPINFTMFLTLFGVKLTGTDPEDVLKNAFSLFDENNTGFITEENLRESMTSMGDRYTNDEVYFLFFSDILSFS